VLVSDVMAAFPAYIRLGATIRRAAEMVSVSEVGHLMVLDHDGRFVGSLSEEDLVRAMLPGFGDVTAAGGTLADAFRIFLDRGRSRRPGHRPSCRARHGDGPADRRTRQGSDCDDRPRDPEASRGR
jgi:CBS domain-containing protein